MRIMEVKVYPYNELTNKAKENKNMKNNYDKLFDVLIEWYNEKEINEIWGLLKEYDTKNNNKSKNKIK